MKRWLAVIPLAALTTCSPRAEIVQLTDGPLELGRRTHVLRGPNRRPLPANLAALQLCIDGPPDFDHDRWGGAFQSASGERILVGATAYHVNGSELPLFSGSVGGRTLCLYPGPQHPRPPVREVHVYASAPIMVQSIRWHNYNPK